MEDKTLETLENLDNKLLKIISEEDIDDFKCQNARAQSCYIEYLMNVMYGAHKDVENLGSMFINYSFGAIRDYWRCYPEKDVDEIFKELE